MTAGQDKRMAEGGVGVVEPSATVGSGAVSGGNGLLHNSDLLTPRMAAELEIVQSVKSAGTAVRDILEQCTVESVAEAMAMKTRANLAMQVLEAANNIGAGSQSNGAAKSGMQLPAAGLQSGSLATMLAQRMAAKRNAQHVVQRRVVEVVQPTAAATVDNATVSNSDSGSEKS